MRCPLSQLDCIERQCAVYIVSSDICSIPIIAISLQDIYEELHEIRTRIPI